ncbi:MAG: hypothetical protein GY950_04385, partial [bacterium]|nr:hypothetical protein [bacterium]
MMKKGLLPRQTFIFTTALFLIWLQPLAVQALRPNKTISNYIHNVWTTKDGLPQNTIYSIAQDIRGYVWIGTDRGLVRYDGLEFKHFNKSNTPAIKNDSITTLFIAGDQTMWVGTYGGGIALYKNNHFYAPTSIDKLPNLFIQSITEDKENNIWIGTIGGGIIHFKDNLFSSITSEVGLSNDIVSTVLADSKGKLWIGTSNGLDCLENGEFTKYKVEQGLLDNNIKTLYEDRRGNLWIGTTQGVNKIRNRESDLRRNRFLSFTSADGLSDNYVRAVREDRHGSIWIATNGGLNRINGNLLHPPRRRNPGQRANEIKFEHFTSIDGLSDNSLQSIYEDRWGNMWIGTSGGGLNALRDGKFTFYTVRDGLASNSVKAIYEAPDDSLWIGTDGAGLNRRKDGKFDLYTETDGLSSNNIESIGADWNGNVWIGTAAGLDVFNGKNFKRFSREDGLSNPS